MTPEQLETLILTAESAREVQTALAGLTGAERKALSTTAQSLQKQIQKHTADKNASKPLKNFIEAQKAKKLAHLFGIEKGRSVYSNATLALFALGPVSALKKQDIFINLACNEAFEQIIVDRKPDWLDQWLAFDLERDWPRTKFATLRRWIREGLCQKPLVDGYYRMFAQNLMAVNHGKNATPLPPLSHQLLADPDMLADVWRLFEIENAAFITSSWLTKQAPDNYETWSVALINLSQAGHLDRERLLNASLQGLHQDLKQNQLAGFHKFHQLLEPDKPERAARQSEYRALLCHKIGHVVKFALSMLAQLAKDQNLDGELFLIEIQSIFFQENKGNALAALKLAKRIIKDTPHLSDLGLKVAVEALRHADLDVQKAGMDLLEEHQAKLDDQLEHSLNALQEFVSVSLRNRLQGLSNGFEINQPSLVLPAADESLIISTADDFAEKQSKQQLSRFNYELIASNILLHAILPNVLPISPIKDEDELIGAVSHAVEFVDSPDEVERILDGISRLCSGKSSDFREKTAPLLHRLEKSDGLSTKDGIAGGMGGVRLAMADLLLTWLTGRLYRSTNPKYFSPCAAAEPALIRLRVLTERVAQGRSQPLIAAPTHSGGWIDPVLWVKRLGEGQAQKISFDRMDFCFSLLRLSPDHRQAALAQVASLSDQYRHLAEFVLGGDKQPESLNRNDYELWISAARARDPYRDWADFFAPLQLDDAWPDSVRPAQYTWRAYFEAHKQEYNFGGNKTVREWKIPKLDIQALVEQPTESTSPSKGMRSTISRIFSSKLTTDWKILPSAALNFRQAAKYTWSSDLNTNWLIHWLSYQWPLKPDGLYLTGASDLVVRLDMDSSHLQPSSGFFQGLFQQNRPWHEAAHLLVGVGLTSKDADAKGLALDALIWGIENGVCDIKILAETLIGISNGGWVKLNRLGDNLLQVSQVSSLHAWVISQVIQLWLPHANVKQQNFFKILEVLLEAQATIGLPLQPKAVEVILQLKGAGKVAKLAEELLQNFRKI